MKLPFKLNPVAVFLIVLCLIVVFSVTAFYLAVDGNYEIGVPPLRFTLKEIYRSEPWTFQTPNFLISIRGESYIVPVYLDERLIGIVVQSNGGYLEEDSSSRRLYLEDFFLTLNSEIYAQIKGDTLFLPLQNSALQRRILAAARSLIRLPELQGIAYPRTFLPPPDAICIYSGDGESILPSGYSVHFNNQRLFLFFSLVVLVVLLTIYLLTMDLHPTSRLKRLHAEKPVLREKLIAGFFLAVLLAAGTLGKLPTFKASSIHPHVIIFYYVILFLLLILRKKQIITNQYFGLASTMRGYLRGMIAVPVILVLIFLFSTLKFPSGISVTLNTQKTALHFAFLFSYAFAAEFFWRGYLQTFLERLWGQGAGLLLATVLFTLPVFMTVYLAYGFPLDADKTLEVFFFYPLTALPLAYLYQRSRNLVSVALLHALLLFLPGFLNF
ncbi:MAG: CPBP family intramembrane glutamic endopeptidase [Bacillota bacterium]